MVTPGISSSSCSACYGMGKHKGVMTMTDTGTTVLEGKAWDDARDGMTRRFLQVSADEFVEKFKNGDYEGDDEPDFLMEVLAYFPELD